MTSLRLRPANARLSALFEAVKAMKQNDCTIITYDYENEEIVDDIRIRFVPFWTWAL